MLLIFKTNDLLRGIEASLGTHANARSFIVMSKSCVKAVYRHKQKRCHTFLGKLTLSFQEKWTLLMISMYEFYLWMQSSLPWNREKTEETVKGYFMKYAHVLLLAYLLRCN